MNIFLSVINWTLELELDNVIFELDCNMVVDHINSSIEDVSEFGAIIAHVSQLLRLLPNFNVEFVWRQKNILAHKFARIVTSLHSARYFDYVPTCIALSIGNAIK